MNKFISTLIIIIIVAVLIALVATEIYVWTTYGNTPVSEVPAWALWFMLTRRGGR